MNSSSQESQLLQVCQYAEMIVKIQNVMDILDTEGGFYGERDVFDQLLNVQTTIRKQLNQHLKNAEISSRARIIINNDMVLKMMDSERMIKK